MRKIGVLVVLTMGLAFALASMGEEPAKPADWSFNATLIEACSCPMFCQCFFNSAPASHGHGEHGGDHYCKFNIAYHVNKGAYNGVKLDGAEFWVSGDLGDSFADGKMDWAELTFDPGMTPEQREEKVRAIGARLFKKLDVDPDVMSEEGDQLLRDFFAARKGEA